MKLVRQFALMLAVLLPMIAPAMACALPDAHLTAAEQTCCKQMKGGCDSMPMPASHGCCHREIPATGHLSAVQTKLAHIQFALGAISGSSSAALLPAPSTVSNRAAAPGITLPQSPPSAISILRV